ncbi:low molecular weight protein arginine phosphatase [Paenibacillus sp. GCM10012307]|uniref:Low molecular weight protein arginine phosphatase n=1 Tax=Paenibacillus roseus TaxID=2798579 RepID=A0A934J229_9BACL|nr:low molecular weight protein arginine phosphatase [Paenibacillus roseus]MBJ6361874.1 low molecular weight protein arginine phosphatase [Paenibacillus roseus]
MKRILFVCTGNTCRSPMAEALLRQKAAVAGLSVESRSAGVSTMDGLPVSPFALQALAAMDIVHSGSSRTVTAESVARADLILTMTTGHKRHLLERYPQAVDKAYTLKEYVEDDPGVLADIAELETLYTELHMNRVLGGKLSDKQRQRVLELERRIPGFDIADPFGGPLSRYEQAADEISILLERLVNKLRSGEI